MTVPFVKMHGAGNDFVMVDDREGTFPADDPDRIASLANRPDGVGCEGVILVQKPTGAADFRMRFFNPDGSEAELCGNGARCVAVFAKEIGAAHSSSMWFESLAGKIGAEILDDGRVRVEMPDPKDLRENFVNSGVPHRIVPCGNLKSVDVAGEGRRIRYSDEFAPEGTNVDFVCYEAPSHVFIRTYERGVEAETGACGTGSVAAAVVGVAQHGLRFPVRVTTVGGYELTIDGVVENGCFKNIGLIGPVCRVFSGLISF